MTFRFGRAGYDLYAEIHQDYYNQWLHGLFMPGVVFGTLLGLPSIFNLRVHNAYALQTIIVAMFFTYYSLFDYKGAILCLLHNWVGWQLAQNFYVWYPRVKNLMIAGGTFVVCLFIQEAIGHTFYEKINSDLWQIPNSISMAALFGSNCFFNRVNF